MSRTSERAAKQNVLEVPGDPTLAIANSAGNRSTRPSGLITLATNGEGIGIMQGT